MKLTPLLASGALALAITLPIVGCAQQTADQPSTTHAAHAHHGMMSAMRGLNLSDQQKDRFKSIEASHRADMTALGAQALAAYQAPEAAVAADTFDETTIRSRASDVAAAEGEPSSRRN